MLFKEIAPIIILLTLILGALIAVKIKSSNLYTIDGILAIFGVILGLSITFLNLIYSNNYLITIGPFLTIASILYLSYRSELLADNIELNFNKQTLKIIQTIYWICISVAMISYYQAESYCRSPLFFVSVSVAVSSLGLEILSISSINNHKLQFLFFKIFLLSLILRLSAYFISPYPVGSDPWRHADLIKDISSYGTISYLPKIHAYYSNYPLMHMYASTVGLLGNFSTKYSMSIIGIILIFSTIFTYLFIKKITNNIQLALFSMLFINFSDFHIQWSTQIIAMSFGIVLYTMIFFLLIEQKEKKSIIYKMFTIFTICILIWTHTVSSFIFMVSMISLYVGSFIHKAIYVSNDNSTKLTVNLILCIFFVLVLTYHWTDPKYPFFGGVVKGLFNSLSNEAEFLGRDTISNVGDSLYSIVNIFGFLILIFFGVIGSLHSLSIKNQNESKTSLIFMIVVLFSIFFIFPIMGIRNIIPYRWPAFIYLTLVLFSVIGIFQTMNIFQRKVYKIVFICILLISFSFLMITNSITNMDSPIYGESLNQKMIWTESEIEMLAKINTSYSGVILTDVQTRENLFQTYLKRDNVAEYSATSEGSLDWGYMGDKMLVWRKTSLNRPVQINAFRNPDMLLGFSFKKHLDENYNNIYDGGDAGVYLGFKRDI